MLAKPEMKRAPKDSRTTMDTIVVDIATINTWKLPPFQRPLRVNEKVRQISELIKETETVPGVVTLGVVQKGNDKSTYLMDGQHRIEAFRLAEIKEALADVRICYFNDLADMGQEFVELNSQIVKMRPDDVLRGMEGHVISISTIRRLCPFVGYDYIRRNPSAAILGMSLALKTLSFSSRETPTGGTAGGALAMAMETTKESAEKLSVFLNMAMAAWGRDHEYARMWSALNLTMCMWLYRKLVLNTERTASQRVVVLTKEQFKNCLMALSADRQYVDWLVGRTLSEHDRSPAFIRIKALFIQRLISDGFKGGKPKLPQPDWASR